MQTLLDRRARQRRLRVHEAERGLTIEQSPSRRGIDPSRLRLSATATISQERIRLRATHRSIVGFLSGSVACSCSQDLGGENMGWASGYIAKLRQGETVSFRPRGSSMKGKIESGQLCTVTPVDPNTLEVGDIVLCRVVGSQYLHIIKAMNGSRFQFGNNRGGINGWITANGIFGKLINVTD
jgi:hypothetical protein